MSDYQLIDAGNGFKLEQFGSYRFKRPDLLAYFKPGRPELWKQIDAVFHEEKGQKGHWEFLNKELPNSFEINYEGLIFQMQISEYKHLGIFPEQRVNWRKIAPFIAEKSNPKVLNLFAYTGGASLIAAQNGAQVTHVDSSKTTMEWAKLNAGLNQIESIRWIWDDALDFVKKEVRRGNQYDLIIMDPPAFGMSKKKKKWQLTQKLPDLINDVSQLVLPGGKVLLNTYSPKVNESFLRGITNQQNKVKEVEVLPLVERAKSGKKLERGLVTWMSF